MKIANLFLSLVFLGQACSACAATPIFQLAPRMINTLRSGQGLDETTHPGSTVIARVSFGKSLPAFIQTGFLNSAISSPTVIAALEQSRDGWLAAATSVSRPDNVVSSASRKYVTSINFFDDSLYFFLKNFKRQPRPKPESWTLLLVGLCLLLYQVRRRPIRASIGFYRTSKLAG